MSVFLLGGAETPASLGGKASWWAKLFAASVPVPAGFCIPADQPITPAGVQAGLVALRGVATVAVRSSGVGEDGSVSALAGLFESRLDVAATVEAVVDAATACRAAGASHRAVQALGRPAEVAVLVQEMVSPTRSGVLFTRDPLTGAAGPVVEVVQGHLRHLVDGTEDGARFRLSDADEHTLSPQERSALGQVAELVELAVGGPADIEWASVGGRVVVLQARPMTGRGPSVPQGVTLVAVDAESASRLPLAVIAHDKIELRLVAARLGLGISAGLVGLARSPTSSDWSAAADRICDWGEFIAVLLDPFDLDGEIHRVIGTGANAAADLARFSLPLDHRAEPFCFLLKELQDTASTGVAVALPDGGVRIEVIHGHFITKGHEEPRVYILAADGRVTHTTPGAQSVSMQVVRGRKVRAPVDVPIALDAAQLAEVTRSTQLLAASYPDAGVEFGFTPDGQFFLVDLYRSKSVLPSESGDVLSEGRVVGRVRVLSESSDMIEASIERHVHSRRAGAVVQETEPEILVVSRPYHVLDQLVYGAQPGALGLICDGGALLCHLAVVMREHGVPGLVMPGATTSLRDGERIVLDTRRGSPPGITRL
jgi:phosphohistidine swiveling domain-containing protein